MLCAHTPLSWADSGAYAGVCPKNGWGQYAKYSPQPFLGAAIPPKHHSTPTTLAALCAAMRSACAHDDMMAALRLYEVLSCESIVDDIYNP